MLIFDYKKAVINLKIKLDPSQKIDKTNAGSLKRGIVAIKYQTIARALLLRRVH